jgi:hypothetical protein
MSLGLPASVKYIDRSKRPKRVFIKREDGTLESIFQIHVVDPQRRSAEARTLLWDQDAD